MALTLINPDGLVNVPTHHQVAVVTGSKHVYIAGQVSWDAEGNLIAPGDLAGQVAQVYRNVAKSLAAAGATFDDVVRFTWYAAGWKKEMFEAFSDGVEQARREFDMKSPPASLIGVDVLFEPGIMVEAEVTAIIN